MRTTLSRLTLLCCLLTLLCSCDYSSNPIVKDSGDAAYDLYDLYVDEWGEGGIVAYKQGKKFLIVVSVDEAYLPWGPMGEVVYQGDSLLLTRQNSYLEYSNRQCAFGVYMLQTMRANGISRYPAQEWCDKKNHGGDVSSGSWRLPTKAEINVICGTKAGNVPLINNAIAKHCKYNSAATPLPLTDDKMYWTCIEDYSYYISIDGKKEDYDSRNRAVVISTSNTTYGNKDRWIKKTPHYVRAVKYVPVK